MEYDEIKDVVDNLNRRAIGGDHSTDALKWTQAALNAANAYATLAAIRKG